jgi:hypothetical protein
MNICDEIVRALAMLVQQGRELLPKAMVSPLPPLESRALSSGLAKRTLKNLDFIKNARSNEVHPVTQVVNSLLSLLEKVITRAGFCTLRSPDGCRDNWVHLTRLSRQLRKLES